MTNSEINDQLVLGETTTQYTANIQHWIATVVQYGAVPAYMEPNVGATSIVYNADAAFPNAGLPMPGNLNEWYT